MSYPGGGTVTRAFEALSFMVAALGMFVLSPLLAEHTRDFVEKLIFPRYSYKTATYLMMGYEVLVWPAVFFAIKSILTLILIAIAFALAKRSFSN